MPRRVPDSELRSREYLTPAEMEKLMKAADDMGRGTCLVMVAYRDVR